MKSITPFLMKFAVAAFFGTLVFRYALSYGLTVESTWMVLGASTLYGLFMFSAGWYFGSQDGQYLPILDVGFRFHFTTFLVHNAVSFAWIGLGFASAYESLSIPIYTLMYWGPFIVLHGAIYLYVKRKKSYKNLSKSDLFD